LVEFDESTEEQAIDVSDDRGAARGDAAFSEKIMERGEVLTDAFDGLEVLGLTDERLKQGEIILGLTLGASVMEAEGACAIRCGLTATALEGAMLTACWRFLRGLVDGDGLRGVHGVFLEWSVLLAEGLGT
jgi:hypothetical protein